MATDDSKLPTHRAYAVTQNGERRYWREIGAVWLHGDQEGFNLKLDYLPLNNAEIVIRRPLPAKADADHSDIDQESERPARRGASNGRSKPSPR